MATLVLTAAGSALGAAALPGGIGILGTTISGAAIGGAIGGMAGRVLDQRLFGPGTAVREGPRLERLDVQSSTEGAPIPRCWGMVRLAGQIVWATDFRETVEEESVGGGKGGPSATTRTYRYSVSLALGLCEGPVAGIGRLWADGRPMDLEGVTWRLMPGGEDQEPDPLIAALSPDAPAFRGTAVLVFEDLPLGEYGNRIPQITAEIRRPPAPPPGHEDGPHLPSLIEGVALSPGSGEFALATTPVRRRIREGAWEAVNVNNTDGRADLVVALDQLEQSAPNMRSVLLVVSWFGTDLRAGHCQVLPGVDRRDKATEPLVWRCSGEDRGSAHLVSAPDGTPAYGGTPSDASVVEAIREIRRRGWKVILYPFLLMDIPPGNAAGQPAYPWRGRIEASSAAEVDAVFGAAAPGDFGEWNGETIPFAGEGGGLRRMALHYAHLCEAAGGVDGFVLASELRELTRSLSPDYPAVAALKALAGDVAGVLREGTALTYAADWSEYGAHQAEGGTFFHLDPLWSDPAITHVGIDDYLPLADWRPGTDHLDAATARGPHDLAYLAANVEGGEHADWFYADDAAREAQDRSPIADTAHGEDWVFAPKRLRDWWSNPHHDRPGGIRDDAPTGWMPASKPVMFTETGCAAIDLGANAPNLFLDPKSSESFAPPFSRGTRDDAMQRRFLQAKLSHWRDDPMVDGIHVWTWDARPWPDFPLRRSVWADGGAHARGHWLTGRLDMAPLAELVAEICAGAGEARIDASALEGLVPGYRLDRAASAREALQPLMLTYGFDAVESGGVIRFVPRGGAPALTLDPDALAAEPEMALAKAQDIDLPRAVRLGYRRADAEHRVAAAEAALEPTASRRVEASEHPLSLVPEVAGQAVRRWLAEARLAGDVATFALPPSMLAVEPGDVVMLAGQPWRIARIEDAEARIVEAVRVAPEAYAPSEGAAPHHEPPAPPATVPVEPLVLDVPERGPLLGAYGTPWPGGVAVLASATGEGYRRVATVERPAAAGRLLEPLPAACPDRWSGGVEVEMLSRGLLGATREAVLSGANRAALETPDGWEVVQFAAADLTGERRYRLSDLLRGQGGTVPADHAQGARLVLLDDALVPLSLSDAERGLPRTYRFVAEGRALDHETAREVEAAPLDARLRPWAVAQARAWRDGADLHVAWVHAAPGGLPLEREPPPPEGPWIVRVPGLDPIEASEPSVTVASAPAGPLAVAIAPTAPRWGEGPSVIVEVPA